jgi:hypothetical protein
MIFFNRKVTRVTEETQIEVQQERQITKKNKTQKQLEILERKEMAIRLRCDGYSYREISDIMWGVSDKGKITLPQSYDERYAWRDVNDILDEAKEHLVESAEVLRAVEMRNLDRMQTAVMDKAMLGSKDAIETVLKIMKQRQEYVPNLVEPKQVKVSTWQSEILDLIKQGKITIEDVKDVAPEIADRVVESLEPGSKTEDAEGDIIIEGKFNNVGETEK